MKITFKLFPLIALAFASTACIYPQEGGAQDRTPDGNGKTLVVYFSWGGTTERMARMIAESTGADLFEIEPAEPYPAEYVPCTGVAKEELDNGIYRALKTPLPDISACDTVFIGSPVWWHTAAMIVQGAVKDTDFSGKTVVPFCTYAATYRDETLARITELTPGARHLEGLGLTRPSQNAVDEWLSEIGVK